MGSDVLLKYNICYNEGNSEVAKARDHRNVYRFKYVTICIYRFIFYFFYEYGQMTN